MEIVGRLTGNAVKKVLPNEKEVVNFTIVVNNSYRPKGSKEIKRTATYFDCSLWFNAKMADYLKKGDIVQAWGEVAARAWVDQDGDARAGLNFLVKSIHLFGSSKKEEVITEPVAENSPEDDLPF